MYAWAYDLFSYKDFCRELELSEPTVVDWCNFQRNICTDHFERHPILLGGPDKIVDILETCFGKRKYNVGRRVLKKWVYNNYDIKDNIGFLVQVIDRSKRTL